MTRLNSAIDDAGSLRKFVARFGMSAAFVSQVVNGKLPISERLAGMIGLRRVVEFEEKGE